MPAVGRFMTVGWRREWMVFDSCNVEPDVRLTRGIVDGLTDVGSDPARKQCFAKANHPRSHFAQTASRTADRNTIARFMPLPPRL